MHQPIGGYWARFVLYTVASTAKLALAGGAAYLFEVNNWRACRFTWHRLRSIRARASFEQFEQHIHSWLKDLYLVFGLT